MTWQYFLISGALVSVGALTAWFIMRVEIAGLRAENDRLNMENSDLYKALTRLTDRDEKGRFVGGKK